MRHLSEWIHPSLSYFGCVFSYGCGSVRGRPVAAIAVIPK